MTILANYSKSVELIVGKNADGPITVPLCHSAFYGETGTGKSKLLECLLRQLMAFCIGFAVIDPHGDLSEDLLLSGAMSGKNFVYLEAPFPFNPFLHCTNEDSTDKRVETMVLILMRIHRQFSLATHPRLERWLKAILYCCAAMKIPLKYWRKVFKLDYDKVHGLPFSVKADMKHLKHCSIHMQDQYLEAAVNRLNSFLTHITNRMVSTNDGIDFKQMIRSET